MSIPNILLQSTVPLSPILSGPGAVLDISTVALGWSYFERWKASSLVLSVLSASSLALSVLSASSLVLSVLSASSLVSSVVFSLVLQGVVHKSNRKLLSCVCLVLAFKFNQAPKSWHMKRLARVKTTLETSEDENYTRNEWRWKLHSKRVKMKTTLDEWECNLDI